MRSPPKEGGGPPKEGGGRVAKGSARKSGSTQPPVGGSADDLLGAVDPKVRKMDSCTGAAEATSATAYQRAPTLAPPAPLPRVGLCAVPSSLSSPLPLAGRRAFSQQRRGGARERRRGGAPQQALRSVGRETCEWHTPPGTGSWALLTPRECKAPQPANERTPNQKKGQMSA